MFKTIQARIGRLLLSMRTGAPLWITYTLVVFALTVLELLGGNEVPIIYTAALVVSLVWVVIGASVGWLPRGMYG